MRIYTGHDAGPVEGVFAAQGGGSLQPGGNQQRPTRGGPDVLAHHYPALLAGA